jgi:hypothetical protein
MAGTEVRNRATRKLSRADQRELQRGLATGEQTRAQLARRFGVTTSYVSQFAKKYAVEIAAIREKLDDEFAGLWIAQKELRIAAYQAEYERALKDPRRNHFEWINARRQILHTVAEELGALPPRQTVTVVPVVHIIENVNLELLK